MADDMDINAGKVITGEGNVESVGTEIYELVNEVASGIQSKSETLGHQEFFLTYKRFTEIGPSCLPHN